ncbi:MAG TPA: hypothetical protein VK986_22785, partial [Tepidisphaeraceae bacterium]|nr:hypothetical protein [Tepidisphaeraceae bacterium]
MFWLALVLLGVCGAAPLVVGAFTDGARRWVWVALLVAVLILMYATVVLARHLIRRPAGASGEARSATVRWTWAFVGTYAFCLGLLAVLSIWDATKFLGPLLAWLVLPNALYAVYKAWFDREQKRSERSDAVEKEATYQTIRMYGITRGEFPPGVTDQHVTHLVRLVNNLIVENETSRGAFFRALVRALGGPEGRSGIVDTLISRDYWRRIFAQPITAMTWKVSRHFHSWQWREPIDEYLVWVHKKTGLVTWRDYPPIDAELPKGAPSPREFGSASGKVIDDASHGLGEFRGIPLRVEGHAQPDSKSAR